MGLRKWFRADALADRVESVPLAWLEQRGVCGLVIDLDNTLTAWNDNEIPAPVRSWVCTAKGRGFRICIVSNAHRGARVAAIAKELGVSYVSTAWKPRRRGFRRAMALIGSGPASTAVIGDQLFTDVLGGNRVKALTVWVSPISRVEFITTQFVRRLERLLVRLARLPNPFEETKGERPCEQHFYPVEGDGKGECV